MSSGKKIIAVIGFSTLEMLGLRRLIHQEWTGKIECLATVSNMPLSKDSFSGFLVTSDEFCNNLDFYLPRKGKVLVFGKNQCSSKNDKSECEYISVYKDEPQIRETLISLIKSIENQEESKGELTSREIEVLKLVVKGLINKEIADKLYISVNTVITHRKNITEKLGVKSVPALTTYAIMNGLI